jgi:hypothetical protein
MVGFPGRFFLSQLVGIYARTDVYVLCIVLLDGTKEFCDTCSLTQAKMTKLTVAVAKLIVSHANICNVTHQSDSNTRG